MSWWRVTRTTGLAEDRKHTNRDRDHDALVGYVEAETKDDATEEAFDKYGDETLRVWACSDEEALMDLGYGDDPFVDDEDEYDDGDLMGGRRNPIGRMKRNAGWDD